MMLRTNRRVSSAPTTRGGRRPMPPEDSSPTSKGAPSSPTELSVEEFWAEQMKPSRQRNLPPQERKLLADHLRRCRRAHFLEIQSGLTETIEDRMGRTVGSIFSMIWNP